MLLSQVNYRMKASDTISIGQITNLVNAFTHAEKMGRPLTLAMVVTWNKTNNWHEDFLKERVGKFLDNVRHWMYRRNLPVAYLWTMENSYRMKLHTNFMFHVPREYFWDLVKAMPNLIPHYSGNHSTYEVVGDSGVKPPKFLRHPNQRKGVLKYFLKGMDHSKTFTGPDGTTLNIGDALGIAHRGQQGRVPGRRTGLSHSLAPTARSKGGYSDETDFPALGDLLAIHRTPTAPYGGA
jgi:hypothetical protein